jgi:alkanesulfonate monooxygenase SsuD/methylene tetrahydromethanopterin reductase-like flavin-dependent oxidoreductase (luciferase family)
MDFGIGYFPTADAVGPGELAAFLEERGFESLVFAEHTHIPAGRESPYPGGGELPRKYTATLDLFVALTAAAVATSRLRVGSGIALVIQRDPIITAKATASIDVLSEFGVGAGWNREEMANHGTDPRTRMRLFAERVEAIKTIWTERVSGASTASSSTSTASSASRSRSSARTRRSWSAASGRP